MSRESSTANESLADDLLWGVTGKDGIAAFLNLEVRKTYYLIENDKLPIKRLGHRTIAARRSELRRYFTSAK